MADTDEAEAPREEVTRMKQEVIEFLDFPPKSKIINELQRRFLKDDGGTYDSNVFNAALTELIEEKVIFQINMWFCKKQKPRIDPDSLSSDDIDWLRGTGRFAQ